MNSTSRANLDWNRRFARLGGIFIMMVLLLTAARLAQANETSAVTTNLTQAVPRSVFIQPASSRQGCDPFFPTSVRPYITASVAPTNGPTADLTSVYIKGISGTAEHRLAIINDVTFAAGDEAEVFTSQGRIRIRCLMVLDDSAVIEAAGQRQILHYKQKQ
jgi:hypothetical protein